MTKKQYIDLINKEVDGLLSEDEKLHLHEYLEKDLKAKNLYQETIRTADLRNQVNDIDPLPNLKKKILNAIDTNLYLSEKKANAVRFSLSDWFTNFNPKLVYAFAAGLIIGLVMYSVFVIEAVQDHSLENINYYGTIGIPDDANVRQLDKIPLDFATVSGTVSFYKLNDIVWFELEIINSDRCTLAFTFNQKNISFDSMKPLDYLNTSIGNEKEKVTINLAEKSHFLLLFRRKTTEKTPIDLYIAPTNEAPSTYKFQLSTEDK